MRRNLGAKCGRADSLSDPTPTPPAKRTPVTLNLELRFRNSASGFGRWSLTQVPRLRLRYDYAIGEVMTSHVI